MSIEEPTWKDFRNRLGKERDRFMATTPALADLAASVHPEEIMDWFSEANDETLEAVETAVGHYVSTHKWPSMSGKEQAFVLLRLESAVWQANSMMKCPGLSPPSLDVPEEHVLRWFLLDTWDCAGKGQALIGLDMAAQSLQSCLASPDDFEQRMAA